MEKKDLKKLSRTELEDRFIKAVNVNSKLIDLNKEMMKSSKSLFGLLRNVFNELHYP